MLVIYRSQQKRKSDKFIVQFVSLSLLLFSFNLIKKGNLNQLRIFFCHDKTEISSHLIFWRDNINNTYSLRLSKLYSKLTDTTKYIS